MQTPRGFELIRNQNQPVITLIDPIAAYANPRFPWMFVHMQNAAILSVALFMAGIAAYYVFRHYVWGYPIQNISFWETMLKIALLVMLITAPLQVIHGDAYARHIYDTQPQKFAAMEAVWETDSYVPEYIIAFPTSLDDLLNPRAKDILGIGIPGGASWLASGGNPEAVVQGLNEFEGSPPVAIVFWAFRLMVALGFWFIILAFWGGYRWWRGELFEDDLLHKALMLSAVAGFFTVELGWIVTEVGRQPWVVQGIMKTSQGVSPGLTSTEATFTLIGFVVGYVLLLGLYVYVIGRLIRQGPPSVGPTGEHLSPINEGDVSGND